MIKNQEEYEWVYQWSVRFAETLESFPAEPPPGVVGILHDAERRGMESRLESLRGELEEYMNRKGKA